MAIDATIHLDELQCIHQHDHNDHSEPYAWTLLYWIDDFAIAVELVGALAPSVGVGSRSIIKSGVDDGEAVPFPVFQRGLSHRFEENDSYKYVGLVVVLREADDSPADAVRAGYSAFVREFPLALGRVLTDFFRENSGQTPSTDAQLDEVRDRVRTLVEPKVKKAVTDELSGWEKFRVLTGQLNLDDTFGTQSAFFDLEDAPSSGEFTLDFRKSGSDISKVNHYKVRGHLQVSEVDDQPDSEPCQAEVDRVNRARRAVSTVKRRIESLQRELQTAAPGQKAQLVTEIRSLRDGDLRDSENALTRARAALERCRAQRPVEPGGMFDTGWLQWWGTTQHRGV